MEHDVKAAYTPSENVIPDELLIEVINEKSHDIFGGNLDKGFWDDERNFGEIIALIHSELSEALEAHRKDKMDDHLPTRSGVEVELADAMIRIMDYAGAMNLDLGGAIVEKLAYNRSRPFKHGKKY